MLTECIACGDEIALRADETGQRGTAWATYGWKDDRDFQCGLADDGLHRPIPADHEVQPIDPTDPTHSQPATCGSCGLSWDDGVVTSMTPTPAARCPFEYFHQYDDEEETTFRYEIQVDGETMCSGRFDDGEGEYLRTQMGNYQKMNPASEVRAVVTYF